MKFGMTQAQKAEKVRARFATRYEPIHTFAWVPRFCKNTQRWVWLEPVLLYYDYYPALKIDAGRWVKLYKEIE